ncbi:MAG: family 78 glycoside hydrolase catalytic domain [Clostridia bacterium]|nr:family 78 glycoside hydrolase catalytic domain [Clostridia bacterium]
MKIYDLKCEYQVNPVNVNINKPAFCWKLEGENNTFQTAYELKVGAWSSGKIESDKSLFVEYGGEALKPETKYNYSVTVWDNHGNTDTAEGFFETTPEKINALWLEPECESVVSLTKEFEAGEFSKAKLYASAFGIYEVYINNQRVYDYYLTPGFTSYPNYIQYQIYNIEKHLKKGNNVITVNLARGWACGRYPFQKPVEKVTGTPAFICELKTDNKTLISTDSSWKATESKIRFSEFYDGETYDSNFVPEKELEITVKDQNKYGKLVPQITEPVRIVETIKPIEIIKTPKGETVIDFGQNMVGWATFNVKGKKGEVVELLHGEVLDKDGNFYNDNLRTAKSCVKYILSGDGVETYHPHFSFQGFRYVKVVSFPCEVTKENFTGTVICTDMERTGYFECSHEKLNKLYKNIIWGHKGNYVDIPTDCPQRDERVGWTGDTQVFCKTAAQNYNVNLFFRKWLSDLAVDQEENGLVHIFIPKMQETLTAPVWGDAATVCPWEIYFQSGDLRVLENNYESMKKWVYYLKNSGDGVTWRKEIDMRFGDWLGLDAEDGSYEGKTPRYLIADAYFARSSFLTKRAAEVLGKNEDAEEFGKLFNDIRTHFIKEHLDKDGKVAADTQTGCLLTLAFDLCDNKEIVAHQLKKLINDNGDRLTTGFVGTPLLCETVNNYIDSNLACTLLLQEQFPSWLFSVNMGATTVWEHWDSQKPDGTFWDTHMNSFNHYAYGSVASFMYERISGITPIEAGYKKIKIAPVTDQRITWAKGSIETLYGKISSDINNERLKVEIPANTTAEIVLPNGTTQTVGSGTYTFKL